MITVHDTKETLESEITKYIHLIGALETENKTLRNELQEKSDTIRVLYDSRERWHKLYHRVIVISIVSLSIVIALSIAQHILK